MLESERIVCMRQLTAGEDVPEYRTDLRFWRWDRPVNELRRSLGLRGGPTITQHIVELVGTDGHLLYAEFGRLIGIDPQVRTDLLVLGWPELGGVIALRYPEGGRQVAEQPLTTRKPKRAVLIGESLID